MRCFFPVDTVDKAEREKCVVGFVRRVGGCIRVWRAGHVSVGRFRADATIARHYRELADREERADKARMAERIERLRLERQKAAEQAPLSAGSDTQFFLRAAE